MLLGLVGRARHGKDTIGLFLRDKYEFTPLSFAYPLKKLAKQLYDFSDEQLFGNERDTIDTRAINDSFWFKVEDNLTGHLCQLYALFESRNDIPHAKVIRQFDIVNDFLQKNADKFSARLALQHLGTEFGRALWPEVWTYALLKETQKYKKVVITDCRFPNEARAIKDSGGILWWVDASTRLPNNNVNQHSSEPNKEDFSVDYTIYNNSTIADLHLSVASALSYV